VIPQPPHSPYLFTAEFFYSGKMKGALKEGQFESLEKTQLFMQLRHPSSKSYKECKKN